MAVVIPRLLVLRGVLASLVPRPGAGADPASLVRRKAVGVDSEPSLETSTHSTLTG